jgi:hypothetical protein
MFVLARLMFGDAMLKTNARPNACVPCRVHDVYFREPHISQTHGLPCPRSRARSFMRLLDGLGILVEGNTLMEQD